MGSARGVKLRMVLANHTYPDRFDVRLNGTLLDNDTRSIREDYIMNSFTKFEYSIPGQVLRLGKNLLRLQVYRTNPQMRVPPEVQNMEVNIEYIRLQKRNHQKEGTMHVQ